MKILITMLQCWCDDWLFFECLETNFSVFQTMSEQHEDISKVLQSAPSFSKKQKKQQTENNTNDIDKDLSKSKLAADKVE
jgi:hypothetical protein